MPKEVYPLSDPDRRLVDKLIQSLRTVSQETDGAFIDEALIRASSSLLAIYSGRDDARRVRRHEIPRVRLTTLRRHA